MNMRICGRLRGWEDAHLCEWGRSLYAQKGDVRKGAQSTYADPPNLVLDTDVAFAVDTAAGNTAIISRTGSETSPAGVVWHGEEWARVGRSPAVLPGSPHGDLGLSDMLNAGWLDELGVLSGQPSGMVSGEATRRVVDVAPAVVILSADAYLYTRDDDVLTSWTAMIDGMVARVTMLTDLAWIRG